MAWPLLSSPAESQFQPSFNIQHQAEPVHLHWVSLTDAVDCIEEGATRQCQRPTGSMVDVVVLECDLVVHSYQLDSSVMVRVTTGGIVGVSVDIIVGNGNSVAEFLAENIMLTTQVFCRDVVDPD